MSSSRNYKLSTHYCCTIKNGCKDFKPYTIIFIVHETVSSMLTVAVYHVILMHTYMYDFILIDLKLDENSL